MLLLLTLPTNNQHENDTSAKRSDELREINMYLKQQPIYNDESFWFCRLLLLL